MTKETTHIAQSKSGILSAIKTETTIVTIFKPEKEWFDARFLEFLLLIDETPRTIRQIIKHSPSLRLIESLEYNRILKTLVDRGLVIKERVNNQHTTYRRVHSFPTHAAGFY